MTPPATHHLKELTEAQREFIEANAAEVSVLQKRNDRMPRPRCEPSAYFDALYLVARLEDPKRRTMAYVVRCARNLSYHERRLKARNVELTSSVACECATQGSSLDLREALARASTCPTEAHILRLSMDGMSVREICEAVPGLSRFRVQRLLSRNRNVFRRLNRE